MRLPNHFLERPGRHEVGGAPEGVDALVLRHIAARHNLVHVARDEGRLQRLAECLTFFAPEVEVLVLPAWDCLPYDRVSPAGPVVGRRLGAMARLAAARATRAHGRILLTTVSAALQRLPPRSLFEGTVRATTVGERVVVDEWVSFLGANGYRRAETVREAGEFALRGGIVDIFPAGDAEPVRLDLFGDMIEALRRFDPLTQISTGACKGFVLLPVSEVPLNAASTARFRAGYRELFGPVLDEDQLYSAVSAGQRHPGMEHWLPLFHETMESVFDYLPGAAVTLDQQTDEAVAARLDLIADHYQARRQMMDIKGAEITYRPLAPDRLYLGRDEWTACLRDRPVAALSSFAAPSGFDAGGRLGPDFSEARARPEVNVFDALAEEIAAQVKAGRRVMIAGYSAGSRDRLHTLLHDHGITDTALAAGWADATAKAPETVEMVVLGIERGFVLPDLCLITEQDILGDRLTRGAAKRKRADQLMAEMTALAPGDLVVHVEHGIGRFEGLETIAVGGAPHDCLRLIYAGGDKLFVPVENIEVLSRYGSEETGAELDRLGGTAWQARKARVKQRIRDIADQLIRIAAERQLKDGEVMAPPHGAYDEFCARFPYPETEDQLRAIEDVIRDLGSGRPMDRLICGDVGFGKTEVALRAAFVAVMTGMQVAVVVPTTLLARQHDKTFSARFAGLPVRIGQLSRLVTPKTAAAVKKGAADGTIDIVIGTQAMLGKGVAFKTLGLMIVDEEQHFGVAQKERLKQLRTNVHVLTLTATPIPRTLQMALSGVRDMSIIATPPVDRLAVRTFVTQFDPVVIREAILREKFRGGQCFYVCPRIADLPDMAEKLRDMVPEVRVATAHGALAPRELERVMIAFLDRQYDVLLSTNIIESGLDIPTANTMIIHRADMFGLAQLYQIRGRVGRSKLRAYAYLTLPAGRMLAETAQRRLNVMQTLDNLGAGFTLASHDLDIRGAGNLLGEEQSGHIREVGIELYQHMLEEAVAAQRTAAPAQAEEWTPQIGIGMPVLIPEEYVADLGVRLSLYRRIAQLVDRPGIDAFAAEVIDRFGSLPEEMRNLLDVVAIKKLCRDAGVEKIDSGPKGAVIAFRNNLYANPAGLVAFITRQVGTARLRPDHRLIYQRSWDNPRERLEGVHRLLAELAKIAAAKVAA